MCFFCLFSVCLFVSHIACVSAISRFMPFFKFGMTYSSSLSFLISFQGMVCVLLSSCKIMNGNCLFLWVHLLSIFLLLVVTIKVFPWEHFIELFF